MVVRAAAGWAERARCAARRALRSPSPPAPFCSWAAAQLAPSSAASSSSWRACMVACVRRLLRRGRGQIGGLHLTPSRGRHAAAAAAPPTRGAAGGGWCKRGPRTCGQRPSLWWQPRTGVRVVVLLQRGSEWGARRRGRQDKTGWGTQHAFHNFMVVLAIGTNFRAHCAPPPLPRPGGPELAALGWRANAGDVCSDAAGVGGGRSRAWGGGGLCLLLKVCVCQAGPTLANDGGAGGGCVAAAAASGVPLHTAPHPRPVGPDRKPLPPPIVDLGGGGEGGGRAQAEGWEGGGREGGRVRKGAAWRRPPRYTRTRARFAPPPPLALTPST